MNRPLLVNHYYQTQTDSTRKVDLTYLLQGSEEVLQTARTFHYHCGRECQEEETDFVNGSSWSEEQLDPHIFGPG